MSEAVFNNVTSQFPELAQVIGTVDSAGIDVKRNRLGSLPSPTTMETLQRHNIHNYTHGSREVVPADFLSFNYILAMDLTHQEILFSRRREASFIFGSEEDQLAQVMLFGHFGAPELLRPPLRLSRDQHPWRTDEIVDGVYYDEDQQKLAFEVMYQQAQRYSQGVVDEILRPRSGTKITMLVIGKLWELVGEEFVIHSSRLSL